MEIYSDYYTNLIFKTKYPNGKIKTISYDFKNNKITFKIKYNRFQKYQIVQENSQIELLQNLGFKVISGSEAYALISTIKSFEKRMNDEENPYGYYVGGDYYIPYTEKDLTEIPNGITAMKNTLKENAVLFSDYSELQKSYYYENINTI